MSERVPVGEVLNEAFQFGFRRWLTIFRFAWAPLLLTMLIVGGGFYLVFDAAALEAVEKASDIEKLSDILNVSAAAAMGIGLLAILAIMALFAGLFASIYRLVALGEERQGILPLRFDGPAQRVFTAQIILTLINYAIMGVAVVIGLVLAGSSPGAAIAAIGDFTALVMQAAADPTAQPNEAEMEKIAGPFGGLMLGMVIAAPALIFANVKLSPFLAGSASENRLLLFGAYRLTSGHFWSLFGVYFLLLIALFVIGMAFTLAMGFVDLMSGLGGSLAFFGLLFNIIGFAATIAYQVFIIGVQLAVQAVIYRRLKTGE